MCINPFIHIHSCAAHKSMWVKSEAKGTPKSQKRKHESCALRLMDYSLLSTLQYQYTYIKFWYVFHLSCFTFVFIDECHITSRHRDRHDRWNMITGQHIKIIYISVCVWDYIFGVDADLNICVCDYIFGVGVDLTLTCLCHILIMKKNLNCKKKKTEDIWLK